MRSIKVAWLLLRKHPSIGLLPLALLCLTVTLGIWGVFKAAEIQTTELRNSMTGLSKDLSLSLDHLLQPAFTLAVSLGAQEAQRSTLPGYDSKVTGTINELVTPDVNETGLIDFAMVLPNGRAGWWVPKAYPMDPQLQTVDVLAMPYRPLVLAVMPTLNFSTRAAGLTRTGPGLDTYTSYYSMFVTGPMPEDLVNETVDGMPRCPPAACYDVNRNVHWWGFVLVLIRIDRITMALQNAARTRNGLFLIRAPGDYFGPDYDVAASDPPAPMTDATIVSPLSVVTYDQRQWTLYVHPTGGWDVTWKTPAIIAVVVGSLVLSGAVMALALYRAHYMSLLESILPKHTLKQLVSDAKKQGLVELALSIPGTTASLILNIMTQLLRQAVEGVAHRDVLAIQSALRSSANIYTPLWTPENHIETLDPDVASNLAMALGTFNIVRRNNSKFHVRRSATFALHSPPCGSAVPIAYVESVSHASSYCNTLQGALAYMVNDAATTALDNAEDMGLSLTTKLEEVLATANSFTFDAFELHEASRGHPLSCLAFYCLSTAGLVERLDIQPAALCRWLLRVEAGYVATNPYHNATHAADVVQTLHALLTCGALHSGYLSQDITHLACYMAAIIHDVGHVGCTNDFLVLTGHELAIMFNDKAPLENMHIATAWGLLSQPGCNFIQHLQKFNAMHGVGSEVLSNMIARKHPTPDTSRALPVTAALARSSRPFRPNSLEGALRRSPERLSGNGTAFTPSPTSTSQVELLAATVATAAEEAISERERLLGLQIVLKCSDLGHTAATLAVHKRWVALLEEEFFRQGDEEKALGLPISPLFDRSKQGVSKSQVGFYEAVVLPLFSSLSHVFPGADPLTHGALSNFWYWKQCSGDGAAAAAAAASGGNDRKTDSRRT